MEYIEQHSSGTDTFYDSGSERYQSGPSGIHETAEVPEVDQCSVRQVYLLTYSQADVNAFPTRRSFVEAVIASFSTTPSHCSVGLLPGKAQEWWVTLSHGY